ncbi:uncharacterized protein BDV17DRAFT_244004 [Aspergillus undulatus]|uniref:uncharacterized protein n=1 Tax=Aspergillus undulatus TaxID=1810928 RepID=UPI003CCE0E3B
MDPVNPASLPPEYWGSLDPYANPDPSHHHSHPPQQQPTPQPQQQQPMGIGWDHPALHSQHSQHDQAHGLYSAPTPQSWHQNPLHHQPIAPATPQELGLPAQYRQMPQYAQGQVTFDSRAAAPTPDNPQYQPYSFSNFYAPQHISIPDTFPQTHSPQPQPAQQRPQSSSYRSLHQNSVPQYTIPPGFTDDPSASAINFQNDFVQPPQRISEQTINPQFINSPQPMTQSTSHSNNQFVYVNPAEDPKMFSYFPDNVQLQQPIMSQSGINGVLVPGQTPRVGGQPMNGLKSTPAVVIPKPAPLRAKQAGVKKQSATKKASPKKTDGNDSVSSGSDSYESSDSELEVLEPEEPSPIPPTRPSEPEAAAQYDTIQAVWFPRNRRPKVDKVKAALIAFKDVVKNLRDAWKEVAQTLKSAENKDESSDTTELRKKVALHRRLMDVVASTTLEKGHPTIVEKLGEHPMAVAAMYSFLLDRHQASDSDGTLTLNILKLLARFVTVDEDVLLKTNISKLLPRYVKKGGAEVKSLAQTILNNAAASTKRKQANGKPGSKEGSPAKQVSGAPAVDGARRDVSGSKRPRDGEPNGQPATKKVVVTSNTKPGLKPSGLSVNGSAKAGQENKPPGTAAAKPKANIVAPKPPTNLFGSLTSASKKPGTSNAERAAAAAAAKSAPVEKKDTRPAFSFGDIMADLNKQKEPSPKETSENKTPETEEERAKRLRKEARRKLRVTWKPDDSLTDVRYFTHDPDEELGPSDRSRKGGDVKGEGSILKLHKNIDELEEDDDGSMKEEQIYEYYALSEIDDSDIPAGDRAGNHIKRGGSQQPVSPEAQAQEHREATTLMVFHTSPADVPSSAKEPPPPDTDEKAPEILSFGEPPDHVKARQERYYAMIKPQPQPPQNQPNTQNNLVFNLLKSIQNPVQQQSTPTPQASQPAQTPAFNLEQTINMLRQQQPQPQPQPQIPQIPQPPAINPQLLAMLYGQQQAQPQPQQLPQNSTPPQQGAIPPHLAAILSQFNNQNQQNQNQQAGGGTPPQAQAQAQTQSTGHYEDPERKRMREAGGGFDNEERWKRNRGNAPNKKHPKAGLVPCRYWAEGRCLKGDDCTFRHDPL